MPTKVERRNTLYGYPNPQSNQFPDPIIQQVDPTTRDQALLGQTWINQATKTAFTLTDDVGGINTWVSQTGGAGAFTSLTVNPGNVIVTAGNLNLGGLLTVDTGATINTGPTAAVNIATGVGTGAVNIATGSAQRAITIGNGIGNTAVTVQVGTGTLSLGANATAHITSVGSATAGASLLLNTPTGISAVAANGLSVTTAGRGLTLPGGILILAGAGTPQGVVTAPLGSLFMRSDGSSTSTRAYVSTGGINWTNLVAAT